MSFTLTDDSVLTEIITECHVSIPFDPNRDSGKTPPPIHKTEALWDTGATNCCITKTLADTLGLKPVSKAMVHHAEGFTPKNVYVVNILLPNGIIFPYLPVTECEATAGTFNMIIGMQLITQGDFAITNKGGKSVVSFRIPSNVTIDFNNVDTLVTNSDGATKSNPYAKTSRNAQCPCGSGKKYKACHGKS